FAIVCGGALVTATAHAETLGELRRELAVKKAYISKLERRIRELKKHHPAPEPGSFAKPVATQRIASASTAPPEPDDKELDRALERILVREGGLVLPAYTYEFSPQLSYAHWDRIQDPALRNSYSAAVSFRMGLPWDTQLSFSLPYVYNEGN